MVQDFVHQQYHWSIPHLLSSWQSWWRFPDFHPLWFLSPGPKVWGGKISPCNPSPHLLLKPFTAPICWRLSPTYNSFRPTGHALIHRLNILNGVPSMCRFLAFKVWSMILTDHVSKSTWKITYLDIAQLETSYFHIFVDKTAWQNRKIDLENPQECNTILVHMFSKFWETSSWHLRCLWRQFVITHETTLAFHSRGSTIRLS